MQQFTLVTKGGMPAHDGVRHAVKTGRNRTVCGTPMGAGWSEVADGLYSIDVIGFALKNEYACRRCASALLVNIKREVA